MANMRLLSAILAACLATSTAMDIMSQSTVDTRGLNDTLMEPLEEHVRPVGNIEKRGKHKYPPFDSNLAWRLPLPVSNVDCNRHVNINRTEYVEATESLKNFCDDFRVSSKGLYVSVSGDVAVYVCAEGPRAPCHRNEWNEAEKLLDSMCGIGHTGSVRLGKWGKIYGRQETGRNFCPRFSASDQGYHYAIKPRPALIDGKLHDHWGDLRKKEQRLKGLRIEGSA